MNKGTKKENCGFEHSEAASELRQILSSFEKLQAQQEKAGSLTEVIRPEASGVELQRKVTTQRKTHLPNCIVVTRLTVLS